MEKDGSAWIIAWKIAREGLRLNESMIMDARDGSKCMKL